MKPGGRPYFIFPLFLLGLIGGIIGGLIRVGWTFHLENASQYHGLLMTGGFLGGLISLERTITMKKILWLIFPMCCGVAIILLFIGQPQLAIWALLMGSLGLLSFYLVMLVKHHENHWYIMTLGSLLWVIGNLKYLLTGFVPLSVNWWIGFILFTIIGERLELTRFLPVKKRTRQLLWAILFLLFFSFLLPFHDWGIKIYGASILLVSIWFIRNDIARINIHKHGFNQYMGAGILTGYFWLTIHALICLFLQDHQYTYDLFIHTFFLGFAFSMIWAHAPIILPAVLGIGSRPYHPVVWLFWLFFQLTLSGRVLVSVLGYTEWRSYLSLFNGISIIAMFLAMGGVLAYRSISNRFK